MFLFNSSLLILFTLLSFPHLPRETQCHVINTPVKRSLTSANNLALSHADFCSQRQQKKWKNSNANAAKCNIKCIVVSIVFASLGLWKYKIKRAIKSCLFFLCGFFCQTVWNWHRNWLQEKHFSLRDLCVFFVGVAQSHSNWLDFPSGISRNLFYWH